MDRLAAQGEALPAIPHQPAFSRERQTDVRKTPASHGPGIFEDVWDDCSYGVETAELKDGTNDVRHMTPT